jgi:flavin-dependent dehydrogenase
MGEKLRLVVLGGSAAGPTAASTARRKSPEARITILEKGSFVSYGA